jgi:hypothetical protein
MKQTKYYIPVITEKKKVVFLNSNNITSLQELIPSDKDVREFLFLSFSNMKNGEKFQTMKILVKPDIFKDILLQIKRKVAHSISEDSINLLLGTNQFPVIQVFKEN